MGLKSHKPNGFVGIGMLIIVGVITAGLATTSLLLENKRVSESVQISPKPTPTLRVQTPTITPTVYVVSAEKEQSTQKIESVKVAEKSFDCVGPDGKVFKTSEIECKKLNEAWGKTMDYMMNSQDCNGGIIYIKKSEFDKAVCCQIGDKHYFYYSSQKCSEDQRKGAAQKQNIYSQPYIKPWDGKITCSFSSGVYKYDFGKLTYEECLAKNEQYWKEQGQNSQVITPTTKTISQSEIDRCKSEVQSEVNSLVNGCYVKFQGSAAEACEQTYRNRGATQTQNCINYGTHTRLVDTIPAPTQKCYSTWDEYFDAHPNGSQITGNWNFGSTPPCD